MKKSELRRQINATYIGFDPDRMKTVHVANGLFAEILGEYYPTDLMNRLVVNERRSLPKNPHKRGLWQLHSNEALLPFLKDDEKIPASTSPELLNRLRFHLHQHLDADNGVYDLDDDSGCAYSSATHLLVTLNRNFDGFSGNFLAYLLKCDFGKGSSPLVAKIANALRENRDPMSTLTYVFSPDEEMPRANNRTYADKPTQDFDGLIASNPSLQLLRECFDQLAVYYPGRLSAQRFLRLITIFGSLILIRYLVTLYNKGAQVSTNGQPIAFLIDAQQGRSARIRLSSQASYLRTLSALTELYAFWLRDWILEQTQLEWNILQPESGQIIQTYQRIVKELLEVFPRDTTLPDALVPTLKPKEVLMIASMQMANNLLKRKSEDDFLSGFVRDLGIRCGLLKPRASSQKRKHFDPQADTIEVLVMALLDAQIETDGITLDDFASRLWDVFGVLFGGLDQGAKDFQVLANLGIQEVTQDDLNENCDAFVARLVALGLAKEYADGLVLIQYPQ